MCVGATVSAEIISLGISHRIAWHSKWNEWFEKTISHRYACDNQCGYFSIESCSRTPKYRYGTTTYKHFWKIWFFISAELILRKWLRSLRSSYPFSSSPKISNVQKWEHFLNGSKTFSRLEIAKEQFKIAKEQFGPFSKSLTSTFCSLLLLNLGIEGNTASLDFSWTKRKCE